jgi:hypothetical protein
MFVVFIDKLEEHFENRPHTISGGPESGRMAQGEIWTLRMLCSLLETVLDYFSICRFSTGMGII